VSTTDEFKIHVQIARNNELTEGEIAEAPPRGVGRPEALKPLVDEVLSHLGVTT